MDRLIWKLELTSCSYIFPIPHKELNWKLFIVVIELNRVLEMANLLDWSEWADKATDTVQQNNSNKGIDLALPSENYKMAMNNLTEVCLE